jgi:hypothetical protein
MKTLAQPTDNPPDPQAATPYFVRAAEFRRNVAEECAQRGWPPPPAA